MQRTHGQRKIQPLRVGIVQVDSGADRQANLARIEALLDGLPPTDVLALPEVFAVRGGDAAYRAAAEPVPGPLTAWLSGLARAHGAWVLGGSLIERDGDRLYNTAVLVGPDGAVRATYRKLHLFEARLESGETIREADTYEAG
ncbi:MAG: carbon-nitrogen hydrolase family protein, partial [Lentisphaerae bacterium]|nr:carbon-nitrogen hydrolase family protein [Lentisphaerota bacterium]